MEHFPELCWPDWEIVELIGTGSYGRVYKIKREEGGNTYYDALKVISIPKDPSEVDALVTSGMDRENITEYFKSHAGKIFREIDMMIQLGGVTNIVSYKDHRLIEKADGVGCDIYIRMELLTPLAQYQLTHPLSTTDVIRMGIDICKALEICEKKNIIHRDIKPANIFVSEYGDFELGDFGIARVATDATVGTLAGTYTYMAPEIYFNHSYDSTVDIYSLGLVLYQYLNQGRLPFMPPVPEKVLPGDMEKALTRRMQGHEMIPPLTHVSPRLNGAVCRACAFSTQKRFKNVSEFRSALEFCLKQEETPVAPVKPVAPATPVKPVAPVTPVKPVAPVKPVVPAKPVVTAKPVVPAKPTKKKKTWLKLLFVIFIIWAILYVTDSDLLYELSYLFDF